MALDSLPTRLTVEPVAHPYSSIDGGYRSRNYQEMNGSTKVAKHSMKRKDLCVELRNSTS